MSTEAGAGAESERLEQLIAVLGELPHCRELGLEVVSLTPGAGTMRLPWNPRLIGNPETGVLHGGAVTAAMDTLMGLVAFSAAPADASMATLDLRIDYLKPAAPGLDVMCEAECYRMTRSVAFVRGTAYQDEDTRIASCTATFMVGSVGFAITPETQGNG